MASTPQWGGAAGRKATGGDAQGAPQAIWFCLAHTGEHVARRVRRKTPLTSNVSDALVFFGATGDLAHKKIFPALQAMVKHGHPKVPAIGVAKAGWTLDRLRARARESLETHGGVDRSAFDKLSSLLSVASMFVSRLDALVDPILEARIQRAPAAQQAELRSVVGKVAVANAKLAYKDWKELCSGARWRALAARGAHPQRLLWASTGTKDPRFSDVLYVESLIGPNTVDTIPPATLDALRDHGNARNRLEENIDDAEQVLVTLGRNGISIGDLSARLLDDGVAKFSAAFDELSGSIEKKLRARSTQHAPRA